MSYSGRYTYQQAEPELMSGALAVLLSGLSAVGGAALAGLTSSLEGIASAQELEDALGQAAAREVQARRCQLGSAAAVPGLAQRPAPSLAVNDALVRAQGLDAAIASIPAVNALACATQAPQLASARRTLEEAAQASALGHHADAHRLANLAEERLTAAAAAACDLVSHAQNDLVTAKAQIVLQSMGYRVREIALAGGRTLWATSGDQTFVALVTEQGDVETDLSGFDGIRCSGEIQRFVDGLRREGVALRTGQGHLHRAREGGELIQRVAREARTQGLCARQTAGPANTTTPNTGHATGRTTAQRLRRWLSASQQQRQG